jgi:hypothetical protein
LALALKNIPNRNAPEIAIAIKGFCIMNRMAKKKYLIINGMMKHATAKIANTARMVLNRFIMFVCLL